MAINRLCIACNKARFTSFVRVDSLRFLKCKKCGLVFLEEFPTKDELNHIYSYEGVSGISQTNTALYLFSKLEIFRKLMHWQGEVINKLRSRSLKNISTNSEIDFKGKVLDVGTGPGTFLRYAKDIGWEVRGTELGDKLVSGLRKSFGKKNIYKGELQNIKFGKEKFDAVTLWHVFEHIPNVSDLLKKIKALLKKDGQLIIEVPHADSFSFRLFGAKWTLLMPPQHLHIWSEKSLREVLSRHGFEVTKVENPPHFGFIFFSSLVKVNRIFLILAPFLIPVSFLWSFATSEAKKGDVIRIRAELK